MAIYFEEIKKNYPTLPKDALFDELRGEWPKLKNNPNYRNTCAIRLSVAFNKAGIAIPNNYREAIDGQGMNLIIKVKTMGEFLKSKLGDAYWGMSKNPTQPLSPSSIPHKKGICVYHAQWTDASGHFDLWTGDAFVGSGNFDDIEDGFEIALWLLQ